MKAAETLAGQFTAIRQQTEALITPLSPEDCQLQSMPDASPAKWHLAHLTWFFETFVLERFEPGFKPFDASFRVLFNSYYTGVGDKFPRPQRGLISRPSLVEVLAYRKHVNERVLEMLASGGAAEPDQALSQLITLGLQHEQQHQELLLTDIKHALSFNPARPAYRQRESVTGIAKPRAWLPFEGGLVRHGYDGSRDGSFSFDHETPQHRVFIAPFELSNQLVTNAEMLAFVADGAYRRPEVWLSMGWDWLQASGQQLPLYWQASDRAGEFSHFTLGGQAPLDAVAPACHLSYFEADAFARWSGARLPTEFEWEYAARSLPANALDNGNFLENGSFHPQPRDGNAGELAQMFGDVWEWTQSNYNPYPGYKPWEGLVGEYNGKFMCNQFVLRGGSCATPQSHIRASYRNFFPPDARWQFSGVRLARDVE